MEALNLLFLCTGNSCRSQMAEGWARKLAADMPSLGPLNITSAGIEAHGMNPYAIRTMESFGVDISSQHSKILSDELLTDTDLFVAVCSHADANCPALPANKMKMSLPFDDPAQATGSEVEIQAEFERICLEIKIAIQALLIGLSGEKISQSDGDSFGKNDVELISRQSKAGGFIPVDVLQLKHRLFAGGWSEEIRRELVMRDPAVGVLLYDPQRDEIVLIKQFRAGMLSHDQSPWILEIVAGMANAGEALADVVKREAKEEANCEITDLIPICEYFNSPGWSDEKVSLFCARVDSASLGGIHGLDSEHEDILVVTLTFEEAVTAIEQGLINNAMAIIAIQWLQLNKPLVNQAWQLNNKIGN